MNKASSTGPKDLLKQTCLNSFMESQKELELV